MKMGNMFNFSSKGLNIGSIFTDALKDTFKVFKWTGKVMFKPVSTQAKSKSVGSNKNQNTMTLHSSLNNHSNKLKNNSSTNKGISGRMTKTR